MGRFLDFLLPFFGDCVFLWSFFHIFLLPFLEIVVFLLDLFIAIFVVCRFIQPELFFFKFFFSFIIHTNANEHSIKMSLRAETKHNLKKLSEDDPVLMKQKWDQAKLDMWRASLGDDEIWTRIKNGQRFTYYPIVKDNGQTVHVPMWVNGEGVPVYADGTAMKINTKKEVFSSKVLVSSAPTSNMYIDPSKFTCPENQDASKWSVLGVTQNIALKPLADMSPEEKSRYESYVKYLEVVDGIFHDGLIQYLAADDNKKYWPQWFTVEKQKVLRKCKTRENVENELRSWMKDSQNKSLNDLKKASDLKHKFFRKETVKSDEQDEDKKAKVCAKDKEFLGHGKDIGLIYDDETGKSEVEDALSSIKKDKKRNQQQVGRIDPLEFGTWSADTDIGARNYKNINGKDAIVCFEIIIYPLGVRVDGKGDGETRQIYVPHFLNRVFLLSNGVKNDRSFKRPDFSNVFGGAKRPRIGDNDEEANKRIKSDTEEANKRPRIVDSDEDAVDEE